MRKDIVTTKRKLVEVKLNVQCFQTQQQSPPHFGLLFQAGRGREGPIVLLSILQIPECHTGRGSAVWERNGGRRKEGGGGGQRGWSLVSSTACLPICTFSW